MLNFEDFKLVVKNTPLVAIDLVTIDYSRNIYIGKRLNNPAKDSYFVPGGRIFKGETFEKAFERISLAELGKRHHLADASFLGFFEHIYAENAFLDDSFGTHYVVLAFVVYINADEISLSQQHSEILKLELNRLESVDGIHKYTKEYVNRVRLLLNSPQEEKNASN